MKTTKKQIIAYLNRRIADLSDGKYYNDDESARTTAAGSLRLVLDRITANNTDIRSIDQAGD